MNELKIFNNAEFGSIRTAVINNEPYLVGKDVAEALGYTDAFGALKKHYVIS
jgi:anti-repressor protein